MAEVNPMVAPSYADAVPPKPANQGGMAAPNYTDEMTWSGASEREGRMDQNSVQPVDQALRGIRPEPIGGSYNPGNAKG